MISLDWQVAELDLNSTSEGRGAKNQGSSTTIY